MIPIDKNTFKFNSKSLEIAKVKYYLEDKGKFII